MKIKEVEFSEDEKKAIRLFIVANSLADDRVFNRTGHEFEFDKDNLPFIGEMSLFCKVLMSDELIDEPEPPNTPEIIKHVNKLDYWLINDGEEVNTNLYLDFEESVINELINSK